MHFKRSRFLILRNKWEWRGKLSFLKGGISLGGIQLNSKGSVLKKGRTSSIAGESWELGFRKRSNWSDIACTCIKFSYFCMWRGSLCRELLFLALEVRCSQKAGRLVIMDPSVNCTFIRRGKQLHLGEDNTRIIAEFWVKVWRIEEDFFFFFFSSLSKGSPYLPNKSKKYCNFFSPKAW